MTDVCKLCGVPVNTRDGYGYERREGVTSLICWDCLPDWIDGGLVGPCGWYEPIRNNPFDYIASFARFLYRRWCRLRV